MTDQQDLDVLGFAGSLRGGSYNRALLGTCVDRAPSTLAIETFELDEIPLYNGDVEDRGDPEPVADLKKAIDDADGLLIVTPEYNHSVPAVTKNAVDWASRPPERVLDEKPVAIAGASPSMTGTARAQSVLRQSLGSVNAFTMQSPGVLLSRAHEKFEDRELQDESTLVVVDEFLESFEDWIRRFAG